MCEDNRQGKGTSRRLSVVILSWKRKQNKKEGVKFLKWEATLTQLFDSRPPTMWSGFKFRTQRPIMGLVCWFLILLRKVFPGTPVFPSQLKPKFHLICSLYLIPCYFKYGWDSGKVTYFKILVHSLFNHPKRCSYHLYSYSLHMPYSKHFDFHYSSSCPFSSLCSQLFKSSFILRTISFHVYSVFLLFFAHAC